MLLWYLELGRWLKKHPTDVHLEDWKALFDHVNTLLGNDEICYLEFGVSHGESFRYWTKLNGHPKSRFYGFDTFTGLPEEWKVFTGSQPQGAFSTGGHAPQLTDPRVKFVSGLFQDTLADFVQTLSQPSQLVVHCDADLYTSTLFVLTTIHSLLVPGAIVMFDDFTTANHDFRAFHDYTTSYRRNYEVIGTAKPSFRKMAIRIRD